MASVLARVQRACRVPVPCSISRAAYVRRRIHQTPIALARKQKTVVAEEDDIFASADAGEDLFGSIETAQEADAISSPSIGDVKSSRKLSTKDRLKRFDDLRKFVADRIGRKPVEKLPPVRNTAWQHLFMLATTKEQMEEVVKLFPLWRDSKRVFDEQAAKVFVRRCEQLHCPTLALNVFSDHSKYGFDLPSLPVARNLLYALHDEHPLQETITLSALFGVYKLQPISSDLVSCAMLTLACFKHASPESLVIAREMVPHLQALLANTDPRSQALPPVRVTDEDREKAWLAVTLAKIEEELQKHGIEYRWLRRWREDSGHAQVSA
ncbi:uncharacterized protein LAESUDRAFT_722793, partial [Laetiporus sulphureus 93-53]